jgi:hypothetical protein
MTLWKAMISFQMVVQAETAEQASELIDQHVVDEVGNMLTLTLTPTEVKRPEEVTIEWLRGVPYGGDGDRTVSEILAGAL